LQIDNRQFCTNVTFAALPKTKNEMENKGLLRKTALNYGLIMGGVAIALSVIQYATGQFDMSGQTEGRWIWMLISMAVTITIAIMGAKKYKTDGDGFMNFGEGFQLFFTMIIYSTLLTVVLLAIYMFVLEPGYQEVILNATHDQMIERGAEPGTAGYDTGMEWTEKMTTPVFMLLITIVQSAIFAAILGLILSAFLKNNRPFFNESTIDSDTEA